MGPATSVAVWRRRPWLTPAGQARCALVASILWLCGLGSVVGLVLGWRALRNPGAVPADRRLAIAAVVLGVIGLVVTAASLVLLAGASSST